MPSSPRNDPFERAIHIQLLKRREKRLRQHVVNAVKGCVRFGVIQGGSGSRGKRRRGAVANEQSANQRGTAAPDKGSIRAQERSTSSTCSLSLYATETDAARETTGYGSMGAYNHDAAVMKHKWLLEALWADMNGMAGWTRGILKRVRAMYAFSKTTSLSLNNHSLPTLLSSLEIPGITSGGRVGVFRVSLAFNICAISRKTDRRISKFGLMRLGV